MNEHHGHNQHAAGADESGLAEILDLDAEVMRSSLAEVTAWIQESTADSPPRRILDVGSGTGTGTFALLQRFERAEVTALDLSEQMLDRLSGKARTLGVADQVHAVQADLDADWPTIEPVDLVWASASLHHMADPGRALAEIHALLRPGGLLAVTEFSGFPRFLPDDLGFGRPGLEERCHALIAEARATDMPHLGADWSPILSRAGFAVEAERPIAIELTPPLPAVGVRYAQASLRRMRHNLDGRLSADDLATLDTLVDGDGPDSILRRDDLTIRAARTVWLARRP